MTHRYDLADQRVRKQVGTFGVRCVPTETERCPSDPHYAVERYVRDGMEVVGVFDGDGKLLHWNLPGGLGRLEPTLKRQLPIFDPTLSAEIAVVDLTPTVTLDALAPGDHPDGSGGTLLTQPQADATAAASQDSVATILEDAVAPAVAAATQADGTIDPDEAGAEHYQRTLNPVRYAIGYALVGQGLSEADATSIAVVAGADVAQAAATAVGQAVADSVVTDSTSARVFAAGLARKYYVMDHLGSVRAVVSASGSVIEARDYYPFGLEMPGRVYVSGSETQENYTGHERDAETGQLYAGARYYDAALGRWHVVDPHAAIYPSWSPYNYVMNNPVSNIDPDGKDTWAVHGTYSGPNTWCPPSQSSCDSGNDAEYALDYQSAIYDDGELHLFDWSGSSFWGTVRTNTDKARKVAAERLVAAIIAAYEADPSISINIVAHSHGGNIAIIAANLLLENHGLSVDNLVTIATPARREDNAFGAYQLDHGAAKRHINVFNEYDPVQVNGGDQYVRSHVGEGGPAGRQFGAFLEINATDWMSSYAPRRRGFVKAPQPAAHGAMHNDGAVRSMIINRIANVLKGYQ